MSSSFPTKANGFMFLSSRQNVNFPYHFFPQCDSHSIFNHESINNPCEIIGQSISSSLGQCSSSSSLLFRNSFFSFCHSASKGGVASVTYTSITIADTSFYSNSAVNSGGNIYFAPSTTSTSTITRSCSSKSDSSDGPCFCYRAGTIKIQNSITDASISQSSGGEFTVLFRHTGSLTFQSSNFSRQNTPNYDYCLYFTYLQDGSLSFSTFIRNIASDYTVYFDGNARASLSNNNFVDNQQSSTLIYGYYFSVSNSYFRGNKPGNWIRREYSLTVSQCKFDPSITSGEYGPNNEYSFTGASLVLSHVEFISARCIIKGHRIVTNQHHSQITYCMYHFMLG